MILLPPAKLSASVKHASCQAYAENGVEDFLDCLHSFSLFIPVNLIAPPAVHCEQYPAHNEQQED
jgi:hypothetical protein